MNIRKLSKLIIKQSDSTELKQQLIDSALFNIDPTILGGKVKVPEKLLKEGEILFPFDNMFFQYPILASDYYTAISLLKDPRDNRLYYAFFCVLHSVFMLFAQGEITYEFLSDRQMYTRVKSNVCGVKIDNQWLDYEMLDRNKYLDAMNDLKDHIHYAFRYLMLINNRDLFIVEETIKTRNKKYKMKQKPVFIVLHPRVIRKKIETNSNHKGGSALPLQIGQERRGHWRIYKHPRYSEERRSKPQKINPYWAGPKSYTNPKDPNKHYVVRLDL